MAEILSASELEEECLRLYREAMRREEAEASPRLLTARQLETKHQVHRAEAEERFDRHPRHRDFQQEQRLQARQSLYRRITEEYSRICQRGES